MIGRSAMNEEKPDSITESKRGKPVRGLKKHRTVIILWAILFIILAAGYLLGMDKFVLAAVAFIWGLGTQIFAAAFALIISYLGAVPLLGPFVVKLITLPIFLLINGLAFIASLVGVKMGHKRAVFESRVAATILMVGILIGYILGKII